MTPQHSKQQLESNLPVVSSTDLSKRYLGVGVEQALSELREPEVDIEAKGVQMTFGIDKLQFDMKLDSLSARLIWVGAVTAILVQLMRLFM